MKNEREVYLAPIEGELTDEDLKQVIGGTGLDIDGSSATVTASASATLSSGPQPSTGLAIDVNPGAMRTSGASPGVLGSRLSPRISGGQLSNGTSF